jgi:hypothetical protein
MAIILNRQNLFNPTVSPEPKRINAEIDAAILKWTAEWRTLVILFATIWALVHPH